MKEENNLVSRVKRSSKVTTSMTSLATKFAGKKYLNFELSFYSFILYLFIRPI